MIAANRSMERAGDFETRLRRAHGAVVSELEEGASIRRRELIALLSRHLSEDGGPPPSPEQFEGICERVDLIAAGGPKSADEERRERRSFGEAVEEAVRDVLLCRNNRAATTGALHELTGGMGTSVRRFGALLHGLANDGKLVRESGVSRAGFRYYLWALTEWERAS